MKIFLVSSILAAASAIWYFYVDISKFFEQEACEEVKKFTYWPIVLNKWNKNDNLRTMKKVFDGLGFEMVNGSEEHWDIMWSIEFPFDRFPDQITNSTIEPLQKLNHFPGTPFIANKRELSTTTNSPYILPSFSFPKDAEKFNKYVKENPDKKFVEKNFDNRGVRLVEKDVIEKGFESENKFLQVFLDNPLLIDGHAFDMGVYVLITSIDPLVIYRFKSECLFRFCAEPYHPFDPKVTDKYVIGENKKHAWEMNSFKHLENHFQFFNVDIFKHYLMENEHDIEELWKQLDDAISSVILSKLNDIIKEVESQCKKFKCTNENFFELFRFDFMVDDKLKVYLLEINMSPNLTPSEDKYEKNGLHYEQVVYSTLKLIGAEGFVEFREDLRTSSMSSSQQNIAADVQECAQCDTTSCESPSCDLCLPCMSKDFQNILHRFYREHQRRGEFKRIFPNPANMEDELLEALTEKNQKLSFWFEAKCALDEDWC